MGTRKITKGDRQKRILLGVVRLYIESGKAIGSNTLKESGFDDLSSATIRNYFARLEELGYLMQPHSSGGRIPTNKAYRLYAEEHYQVEEISSRDGAFLETILNKETKEISAYLQEAVEAICELTNGAAFLSSPRFDQDSVADVKLVQIDTTRCLCAILTDFGLIHTEILYTPKKMSQFSIKRLEEYFHFRLTGLDPPNIEGEEEAFAKQAYNEILLRHFVSYTNMFQEDVYKSGFSKLLNFSEFHDPAVLSHSLSLFENITRIRTILDHAEKEKKLSYWIGNDLEPFIAPPFVSSLIAIPYKIGERIVGACAILAPDRQDYGRTFSLLKRFSFLLGEALTKSVQKYKISYRQPAARAIDIKTQGQIAIGLDNHGIITKEDK